MSTNMSRLAVSLLATSITCLLAVQASGAENGLEGHTADTISMNPSAPTYFGHFAPELPATVARKPALDPETGLAVEEIKPNLFFVTDGIYESAFLVTDAGVVVFDAPPSFAERLPAAIAKAAPGKSVSTLIYSHDHADHIGGSGVFANVPGLDVITSKQVAESLKTDGFDGVPAPTRTFEDELDLNIGGIAIELDTASYHSEDQDVISYIPELKFLVAIDTITPGEVPFMNFGATSDFGRYLGVFDTLLSYDFDLLLPGHISVLGTRQDVNDNRDYAYDVRDTVLEEMKTMYPKFEKVYAQTGYANGNLAYRMTIEAMRDACSKQIIDRWSDRLSVVDIYADSHCQTAVLYYIMH